MNPALFCLIFSRIYPRNEKLSHVGVADIFQLLQIKAWTEIRLESSNFKPNFKLVVNKMKTQARARAFLSRDLFIINVQGSTKART